MGIGDWAIASKPLEFEGVKIQIVESLPKTKIFNGVTVTHPICNHAIRINGVALLGNVGDADVIDPIFRQCSDGCIFYNYCVSLGLF